MPHPLQLMVNYNVWFLKLSDKWKKTLKSQIARFCSFFFTHPFNNKRLFSINYWTSTEFYLLMMPGESFSPTLYEQLFCHFPFTKKEIRTKNVSTEKVHITFLFEKGACQMLITLTPCLIILKKYRIEILRNNMKMAHEMISTL